VAGGNDEILIDVPDYQGIRVTCLRERWTEKIEANHPELAGRADDVAEAIRAPEMVSQDRDYGNRKHHIRLQPDNLYLDVVIEYRYTAQTSGPVGRVVTAFLRSDLRRDDEPLYVNFRR